MAVLRPWPYAALCIAQWLHIAPTLSVYVIFRHPMDQTVKPPLATWIVDVDGVPKTPASSAWSDAYTLVLTIAAIGVLPSVVKVEYDGPDEDLRTTWEKQWEPWGPIVADSFQIIPVNTIVMWFGLIVNIPSGWVLCDGNNGTPDLHALFVVGTTHIGEEKALAGSATHEHDFTSDGHWHALLTAPSPHLAHGPDHRSITDIKVDTGTTDSEYHYPPCMRLAYIMKV